jgi:hypothetical protein
MFKQTQPDSAAPVLRYMPLLRSLALPSSAPMLEFYVHLCCTCMYAVASASVCLCICTSCCVCVCVVWLLVYVTGLLSSSLASQSKVQSHEWLQLPIGECECCKRCWRDVVPSQWGWYKKQSDSDPGRNVKQDEVQVHIPGLSSIWTYGHIFRFLWAYQQPV